MAAVTRRKARTHGTGLGGRTGLQEIATPCPVSGLGAKQDRGSARCVVGAAETRLPPWPGPSPPMLLSILVPAVNAREQPRAPDILERSLS